MTPFELHVEEWKECTRCELHKQRNHVVFARGSIPARILLVGEAPGMSEDSQGYPFIGKAGKMLDEIIARSIPSDISYCLYNILGCIPRDEEGEKSTKPDAEWVHSCLPRIEEFIPICSPELIIAVGKISEEYLTQGYKYSIKSAGNIPLISITHPAAILRQPNMSHGLSKQRCVVLIQTGIAKYLLNKE